MVLKFIKYINSSAYKRHMVYLRSKKFKRKKDEKERTYYYLVEAKRDGKKVSQKVLRYLGTADTISETYKELETLRQKSKE
jgi:hypothetical protein